MWLDWSLSGYGKLEISYDCGNEASVSMKCWETTEWPRDWWPLR
jgi:hypothetical protein